MHAQTTYSMEVRVMLCPRCGAPIDVAPNGGLVRCTYCQAQCDVFARGKLAAFLPREAPQISEAERMLRLRAQEGQLLLPPPGVAPLMRPTGGIAAHRQSDALVAWQNARTRTSEQSLEAAEELFFLTTVLSNQLIAAKDFTRHRAMLESALEAFFLPRHRATMASDLCCGACREKDVAAAERWLALADSASDDLIADSNYRIARARLAALKGDHDGVLTSLGQTAGDVPFHSSTESLAAVRRADAFEHVGRLDLAVRELATAMGRSPDHRATVELIVQIHGLCPQSFPHALAQTQERSANAGARLAAGGEERTFGIGKILLLLAPMGFVAAGVAIFFTVSDPAGPGWEDSGYGILAFFAGVGGAVLLLVGLLLVGTGRSLKRDADSARFLAIHGRRAIGTVLAISNTGLMKGAAFQASLRLRVELDGATPYEADTRVVLAPHEIPAVGATIRLRVDPNNPLRVAPEK